MKGPSCLRWHHAARAGAVFLLAGFLIAGAFRAVVDCVVLLPEKSLHGAYLAIALTDPTFAARRSANCLIDSFDTLRCMELLNQALHRNQRARNVRADLARLAENLGELESARRLHLENVSEDGTFQPLWGYWNFVFRQSDWLEFERLTPQVLRMAPRKAHGHFALLLASGLSIERISESVARCEDHLKQIEFLYHLSRSRPRGAAEILLDRLSDMPIGHVREPAIQFVQSCVRDRDNFSHAALVWRRLISRGLLADRGGQPIVDGVLNPNPRLQMPFLRRTFDWSAIGSEIALTTPLSDGGGMRMCFRRPTNATPLLSKLVVFDVATRQLRITSSIKVAWPNSGESDGDEFRNLYWQVRAAANDALIAESPAGVCDAPGPSCHHSQVITWRKQHEAIYVILFWRQAEKHMHAPFELQIREVVFGESSPGEKEESDRSSIETLEETGG